MDNAPEKISAFEKRLKRQVIGKPHRFLAVIPLGFEQTFVREILAIPPDSGSPAGMTQSLKSTDIRILGDGKVKFTAKLVEAWKIAAYSRIANRVLMHIADFKAENFRDLEKKTADIPWELFLPEERHVDIHVTCKHSRLYHSGAVAERLYKVIEGGSLPLASATSSWRAATRHLAVSSATPSPRGSAPNTPHSTSLYVTLIDDRCTIWLDLAGEELYKRGHERFVNDAPLKETIAAAMLFEATRIADAPVALFDLMAGSGTFSLEAAYAANRLIPGVCRDFALKHQPAFKEPTWDFLIRRETRDERREKGNNILKIVTSDISERAVEIIQHNVECSPLAKSTTGEQAAPTINPQHRDFFSYTAAEIADACPGEASPVILLNPPYGKRLDVDAPGLYTRLGRRLAELARALEPLGKHLTVGILAPKDDSREGSKFTCTGNLLREFPELDPARNPHAKKIATSHGGIGLNALFARV